MDKIYKRLNWNTGSCNGSMDSDKYLHSQIARAICEAAYEKPVTVEEISLKTGLPTIFIEDELPKLIYGDAIVDDGNGKYSTDFIIMRLKDTAVMEKNFAPIVGDIADYISKQFAEKKDKVKDIGFVGCDKDISKLGYIALHEFLRSRLISATGGIESTDPGTHPRKDGGYGWFIVDELDENGNDSSSYGTGCNIYGNDNGRMYYYWMAKYFQHEMYRNGTVKIGGSNVIKESADGKVPDGFFSDEQIADFIKYNLVKKTDSGYEFTFSIFNQEQFREFRTLFKSEDKKLDTLLGDFVNEILKSFKKFVPKRLDSQINQRVYGYTYQIIAYVAEELIKRGILETPNPDIPMTNGIFYVSGEYIRDI